MASPKEKDPLVGEMLDGFRVLELLGVNETGRIYQAIAVAENRMVALKLLPEHLVRDPKARERFVRQIKLLKALEHPGVVRLLGHNVRLPRPYYVMEFVAGESLDRVIGPGCGTWPPGELLRLAGELLEAVKALHDAGGIHRNLTPSKIMHDAWGSFRIIDFGLAYCQGWQHVTEGGDVLGALTYQPPEVLAGGEFDVRSDLYQVGVLLTEATAGKNLADIRAALPKGAGRQLPPLSHFRKKLPAGFSDMVGRLTAEDPDRRFPDTASALAALSEVLVEHEKTQPGITAVQAPEEMVVDWSGRLVAGAIVLSLLIWGGWKIHQRRSYRAFRETRRTSASHLTLEWLSGLGHGTAVELRDLESGERRVVEVAGPKTRRHRISLPLPPGRTIAYAALLPGGMRALEGEVTLPARGLEPEELRITRSGLRKVTLEVRTPVPSRARLVVPGATGTRLEESSGKRSDSHSLVVELPEPEFRAVRPVLELADEDQAVRTILLDPAGFHGSAHMVRSLFTRWERVVVPLLGRAGGLDAAALWRELGAAGILAGWKQHRPLVRVVLADALVDSATRRDLRERLSRLRDLVSAMAVRGSDRRVDLTPEPGDPLVPDRVPGLPGSSSRLRPLRTEAVRLQPEGVRPREESARAELTLDLELAGRERRKLRRAVLYLELRDLRSGLILDVEWNGEFAFSLRAEDLVRDSGGTGILSIPLPLEQVRSGRNRFELRARPVLGQVRAKAATLVAAHAYLEIR